MLDTNKNKLIKISVQGKVSHPVKINNYHVTAWGVGTKFPETSGITYNVKVGDCCMNLVGDHVEPGVSLKAEDDKANGGLNFLACIGNRAKVITGDAKGELGYVTGFHGGIEHTIVYFPEETLEKMTCDDKVLIKGYGQGLKLDKYPDIAFMNLDPDLFEKMNIREEDGKIIVPVAKKIPAYMMGSGIGSSDTKCGDYDIMTADKETVKRLELEDLRFGDIIMLEDCDTVYGRSYLKGGVTIGVVIHGDSFCPGHGPGVTSIISARSSIIVGELSKTANIADILKI